MKKTLLTLSVLTLLFSCKVHKETANVHKDLYFNTMTSKVDEKSHLLNELVFGINYIAKQTDIQKVLFDNYGKWTDAAYVNGATEPILIWKDIQLFQGEKDLYTLAAYGGVIDNSSVATLLVFDEKGKDLLSKELGLRDKISSKFISLLKNKSVRKDFINSYTQTFHPSIKNVEYYVYGYNYNSKENSTKTGKANVYSTNRTESPWAINGINYLTRPIFTYNKGGLTSVRYIIPW